MLALRFAALLAAALWIGGLVALGGIAAPAIFDVITARQAVESRMLAGAVFGEIFRRFHVLAYVCAAIILTSLAARAVLGPRPRRFAVRVAVAVVMLGTTLYSGIFISPKVSRMRDTLRVAPSSLPSGDPRRTHFERLHATSIGLQVVPLVGGLMLMFWELRD